MMSVARRLNLIVSHFLTGAGIMLFLLGSAAIVTGQPVDSLNVLFLGNSYTYVNNLPDLIEGLALAADKTLTTTSNTPGGHTLEGHSGNATSLSLIASGGWDHVVLQEQSQMPTIEYWRENSMYPAARLLDSLITDVNAATLFFMTWGREHGGQQCIGNYCSPVFVDYFHMQDSLASAYRRIATELEAVVSPVGEAWALALLGNPQATLWSMDQSHPSLEGSYLAACVFYTVLFNESPLGLEFTGGLSEQLAEFYQQIAADQLELVNREKHQPHSLDLLEIYPNPFNPDTQVRFQLSRPALISLSVFNIGGQLVSKLMEGMYPAGLHQVTFEGNSHSSGVYLCQLNAGDIVITGRMLLIR